MGIINIFLALVIITSFVPNAPSGTLWNADNGWLSSEVPNLEFNKMALSKTGVVYLGGSKAMRLDVNGNVIEPSATLLATIKNGKYLIQTLPGIGAVREIYLFNGQLAVISGVHKYLLTSDGGKTWETFLDPPGTFGDLFFLNRETAWFTGDDSSDEDGRSAIFKWSDSQSERIARIEGFPHYRKFYFASDHTGWTIRVKNGKVSFLRSKDGGRTWIDGSNYKDETMDFQFFDANSGYILRESGLYATIDGGAELSPVPTPKGMFRQMFFIDHRTGWLIGTEMCSTETAGDDWECWPNNEYGKNRRHYIVAFTDNKNGWKLTKDGLFLTKDGGQSWEYFAIAIGTFSF